MSSPRRPHHPVRDLVRRLGGPTVVARALGTSLSSVSNWSLTHRGIPERHHLALWRLAVERGVAWRPPGTEGLRLTIDNMDATQCGDAGAFTQSLCAEGAAG